MTWKWCQKCSRLQIIEPMTSKWCQKYSLLQIIELMTSKWCQKCSSLQIIEPKTSKWCQKCRLLQIIEPLTKKTWGQGFVICYIIFLNKELIFSFKSLKIFWILNNKAIEFSFQRIWWIMQILDQVSLICRILHILLSFCWYWFLPGYCSVASTFYCSRNLPGDLELRERV